MPVNPAIGLLVGGFMTAGAHVCESPPHGTLMAMASRHARYQASHHKQGHQLWVSRYKELQRVMGSKLDYREICAESWKDSVNKSHIQIGREMFQSWQQSDGHWGIAKCPHEWFGYDMHKSDAGIWYACIIVADPFDK